MQVVCPLFPGRTGCVLAVWVMSSIWCLSVRPCRTCAPGSRGSSKASAPLPSLCGRSPWGKWLCLWTSACVWVDNNQPAGWDVVISLSLSLCKSEAVSCAAGFGVTSRAGRQLAQSTAITVSSPVYFTDAYGDMFLVSHLPDASRTDTTRTLNSRPAQGGADTITVQNGAATSAYADQAGFVFNNLAYQELVYSPAIVGASCIFYSFGSNFSTLSAYLTTDKNLDAMLNSQVLSWLLADLSLYPTELAHPCTGRV